MSDVEILEHVIGGQMIKNMGALSFIGWLAEKLNKQPVNDVVNELKIAVNSPPMTGRMSDETKINYVRKLLSIGIAI